jgi:hypothetical protein
MNRSFQPRPWLALPHACRLLVSFAPGHPVLYLCSLPKTTHPDDLRLYLNLVLADLDLHRNFLKPLRPISPIQST